MHPSVQVLTLTSDSCSSFSWTKHQNTKLFHAQQRFQLTPVTCPIPNKLPSCHITEPLPSQSIILIPGETVKVVIPFHLSAALVAPSPLPSPYH